MYSHDNNICRLFRFFFTYFFLDYMQITLLYILAPFPTTNYLVISSNSTENNNTDRHKKRQQELDKHLQCTLQLRV